jgi:hypothetical protein
MIENGFFLSVAEVSSSDWPRAVQVIKQKLLQDARVLVTVGAGTWKCGNKAGSENVYVSPSWKKDPICPPEQLPLVLGIKIQTWANPQCEHTGA